MADTAGPLARLDRLATPIEDLANLLAAFAILALMMLGVTQIVMRSVFNSPISGYIDMVELSMASMAFLGAAYCQRLGAHIRMELFIGRFKGRSLWIIEALTTLVAIFIIAMLIQHSWSHFMRSFTMGDTTMDAELPVWPSKLLVPLAFSLWLFRLLLQFAGAVRLALNPDLEPEAVVLMKDVAEQAQDEIHEALGDDSSNDGGALK